MKYFGVLKDGRLYVKTRRGNLIDLRLFAAQ